MLTLVLISALAQAHEPGDCPPVHALLELVGRAPLSDELVHCSEAGELTSPQGRAASWVAWRQQLWVEGPSEPVLARLHLLLPVTDSAERLLEAAEALATSHPEGARLGLERASEVCAGQPWSTGRVASLTRASAVRATLDGSEGAVAHARLLSGLGVLGEPAEAAMNACQAAGGGERCREPLEQLPQPSSAEPEELRQCQDLGRLWSRALFGGVYATDRDCVVRMAGTLTGEVRQSAAHLGLAMALRHRDRPAALLVAHRVAELLPEDAEVAGTVASLHVQLGDSAGSAWWAERSASLSSGANPSRPR